MREQEFKATDRSTWKNEGRGVQLKWRMTEQARRGK
jgi:hypothetical protein